MNRENIDNCGLAITDCGLGIAEGMQDTNRRLPMWRGNIMTRDLPAIFISLRLSASAPLREDYTNHG